jgi:CBS domain-containing protein
MVMRIQEVMSNAIATCRPNESLNRAAQIMWEHDCGSVPVVDEELRVVGMITDRDVCMAAYTQGRALSEIPVASACAQVVVSCRLSDTIHTVENLMRAAQIRRLPVIDEHGKLCGVVSLADLARHVHRTGRQADGLSYESISLTLAVISRPGAENGKVVIDREVTGQRPAPTVSAS